MYTYIHSYIFNYIYVYNIHRLNPRSLPFRAMEVKHHGWSGTFRAPILWLERPPYLGCLVATNHAIGLVNMTSQPDPNKIKQHTCKTEWKLLEFEKAYKSESQSLFPTICENAFRLVSEWLGRRRNNLFKGFFIKYPVGNQPKRTARTTGSVPTT